METLFNLVTAILWGAVFLGSGSCNIPVVACCVTCNLAELNATFSSALISLRTVVDYYIFFDGLQIGLYAHGQVWKEVARNQVAAP